MKSKFVIVAGGAGFIGSHTAKSLWKQGYVPVVVDNLSHGHSHNARFGTFHHVDLFNHGELKNLFENYKPKAVMHFAGLIEVGESVLHPMKYFEANVGATLSLLSVMEKFGYPPLIYSSSCAVYGNIEKLPLTEDHPIKPTNPYGVSKWIVEELLKEFGRRSPQKYAVLRYFNAAGADPDGELGEEHEPESHLIPRVLKSALSKTTEPFSVYGNDYETPDGTCVRDYIHVSDLAQGHIQALRYLERGGPSDVFNLGSGKGASVLDVLKVCERVTGVAIPYTVATRRQGDVAVLVADAAKARNVLQWTPEFSDLEVQVRHAWNWFTRPPEWKGRLPDVPIH